MSPSADIRACLRLRRGDFLLAADFEAPSTGVTGVFGPSGCGKTSLLRAVAGLEPRAEGLLRVGGTVWQDGRFFLAPHRRPLGYVDQEAWLFPHRTVRDNLSYGYDRVPPAARRLTPGEAVDMLGIGPLLDRTAAHLSGGERQRVAIARALLTSPRLLLLDEPLASLDAPARAAILPRLDRLRADLDIPVLYVSHAVDEVARLADHLLLMEAGRIVASGPVADLLTRLDLPPARSDQAEAMVEAVVEAHDDAFHLTELKFSGGRLTVPRTRREPGETVRLRVRAKDVSLTLERQSGTSILNVFPATVTGTAEDGPARLLVRLDAGGTALLARVTRKSAQALDIAPGRPFFAQVKSVAVMD